MTANRVFLALNMVGAMVAFITVMVSDELVDVTRWGFAMIFFFILTGLGIWLEEGS